MQTGEICALSKLSYNKREENKKPSIYKGWIGTHPSFIYTRLRNPFVHYDVLVFLLFFAS